MKKKRTRAKQNNLRRKTINEKSAEWFGDGGWRRSVLIKKGPQLMEEYVKRVYTLCRGCNEA